MNGWWVLNMMFIIVWYTFLFTWTMRSYTKLLICGDVVNIDVHVDNGHDYVLVLIMMMLVNNHNDSCWTIMMIMLMNYIYVCAYMLIDGDVCW